MSRLRGRFIWREAMTNDVAKTRAFYAGLFGWTYSEMPMGEQRTYVIIENGGTGIGGIMKNPPGVPTHWESYVDVSDVDAVIASAKAQGGGSHWGPIDVPEVGRMGGVHAADRAALSVMNPIGPDQAPPERPLPGAFCWESLTTKDVDGAKAFWTAVLPWQASTGAGYATFAIAPGPENQIADITPTQDGPAAWLTFVVVTTLEDATAKAQSLGGKVVAPPFPVPGIGRIAVIVDDQASAIGLFEPG